MTPAAILEALILAVAQAGLSRLAPILVAKLPAGILQTIVKDGLASPLVQGWISKAEGAVADEAVKLVGEAVSDVKAFAEKHVAASLVAAIESALPSDFQLHLTAADVKLFAADVVAGKWAQVEAFGADILSGAPAP